MARKVPKLLAPEPMPKRILALDLSTSGAGVVVLDVETRKHLWLESVTRVREDESRYITFTRIRDRVIEVASRFQVDDVFAEECYANPQRPTSIFPLFALHGVVGVELLANGYASPRYIPVSTMKKWITGKGRAEKEDVTASLQSTFAVTIEDDNIADAYAIGQMGIDYHLMKACRIEPTSYQREAAAKWRRLL